MTEWNKKSNSLLLWLEKHQKINNPDESYRNNNGQEKANQTSKKVWVIEGKSKQNIACSEIKKGLSWWGVWCIEVFDLSGFDGLY